VGGVGVWLSQPAPPLGGCTAVASRNQGMLEWDKVVHTRIDFKKATPQFWVAHSKLHEGEPLLVVCDDLNWQDLHPTKERPNASEATPSLAPSSSIR
jgi:hypothetical protein